MNGWNEKDATDDLFAYARRHDPETSKEAANALSGSDRLAHLFGLIKTVLSQHPEGLTTTEIAEHLQLGRDSISPRMKALVTMGLVCDSGEKRVPEGKTRSSIVWKLRP